jgi:hypothetical protein
MAIGMGSLGDGSSVAEVRGDTGRLYRVRKRDAARGGFESGCLGGPRRPPRSLAISCRSALTSSVMCRNCFSTPGVTPQNLTPPCISVGRVFGIVGTAARWLPVGYLIRQSRAKPNRSPAERTLSTGPNPAAAAASVIIPSLAHNGILGEHFARLSTLARPLEIARSGEDDGVGDGERASQNDDSVFEQLPCAGRVVAGESRRAECREGLRRQHVLLAE